MAMDSSDTVMLIYKDSVKLIMAATAEAGLDVPSTGLSGYVAEG